MACALLVVLLASCTAAADDTPPVSAGTAGADAGAATGAVGRAAATDGTVAVAPAPSASDVPSGSAAAMPTAPPSGSDAVGADVPGGSGAPIALAVAVDGPPASVAGLARVAAVVEYPAPRRVGGTATLAVTRAPDGVVGPLRAASPRDLAVAASWAAALVTTRTASVAAGGLPVLEEGAPPGVVLRDPARRAPDNAYAVVGSARDVELGAAAAPAPAWIAGAAPPAAGRRVYRVTVAAATPVTWSHDAVGGGWTRAVEGARATTVEGGPVRTATVVVAETPRAGTPPSEGRAGPAVILRDGRRYAARWVATGTGGGPALEQADGTAFPVAAPVWLHWCAPPCAQQIAPAARRPDAAKR